MDSGTQQTVQVSQYLYVAQRTWQAGNWVKGRDLTCVFVVLQVWGEGRVRGQVDNRIMGNLASLSRKDLDFESRALPKIQPVHQKPCALLSFPKDPFLPVKGAGGTQNPECTVNIDATVLPLRKVLHQ